MFNRREKLLITSWCVCILGELYGIAYHHTTIGIVAGFYGIFMIMCSYPI